MTRIGVFGLGYVGAVSAAALANEGHDVIGVDPNLMKVEMIDEGRGPVIEPGLDDLLREGVIGGRIRATTDAGEAVRSTDVSLICVGTPSNRNGSLDLSQVEKVCQEIGLALADVQGRHLVVVRSTMLPGSTARVVIPTLEAASGRRADADFGVCVNPEFLREGTSIADFYHPPFTLIGGQDDLDVATLADVYGSIPGEVVAVPIAVAEMVKYVCNAFHAVKVAFANEVANVCDVERLDPVEVMDVLCRDTKLNISPAYLRPGFAFGGSCLPKDLRALVHLARRSDVEAPLLESIARSNAGQIDRAVQAVAAIGSKRVGVLGLAFKAGTDDLRESPVVELIERLIGKGFDVRVYDRNVTLANLHGANRVYIEREIPHIATLMVDTIADVVAASDVVVIGNGDPAFEAALETAGSDIRVIDLVRARGHAR
jgi:GDP-mannose 6-dehydrogenase